MMDDKRLTKAELDHLLEVMRDANQPDEVRMKAAEEAAPYCHLHMRNGEWVILNTKD
jgi:hypothetical protein